MSSTDRCTAECHQKRPHLYHFLDLAEQECLTTPPPILRQHFSAMQSRTGAELPK
ncbi:uncharacterized protein BKA78DRAFT_309704 [Phyllosticta capitalensis]|uniref:uncharacterized protein n=1 Tax=Phyllosticta capitalensis TaxID=121624 RepID=UPI0031304FF1